MLQEKEAFLLSLFLLFFCRRRGIRRNEGFGEKERRGKGKTRCMLARKSLCGKEKNM
jgi:hypothetical protein